MAGSSTLQHLLADLARGGVRLKLGDDGQLTVIGPLTADLRDRVVAAKPDLLTWLAVIDRTVAPAGPIGPVPILAPAIGADPVEPGQAFPLADLQTSLLIGSREGFEHHVLPHQYLEFDLVALLGAASDIAGPEVEPKRFEDAWNRALTRQRANLVVVTDDLRLRTLDDWAPLRVDVVDVRGLPAAEADARLLRVRDDMRRRELPVDRWPWLDVRISLLGSGRARLHYNHSNFFCDAPGMVRLLDTVVRLYHEPDLTLPEPAVSFRDRVLALSEQEGSAAGRVAEKYWRDRMPAWPDAVALPMISTVDLTRRSRLQRRELLFSAEVWSAVCAAGAAHGLTATGVANAVYAEVLAYWSNSRHFLLNNMISHRTPIHPEFDDVLGNFAALYPLEVDWRGEESFVARARRLQDQVLSDMQHTAYSGAKVLQALNQVRGTPGRAVLPVAVGSALFVGAADKPDHSVLETPQVALDCEFWHLRDGRAWVVWDVVEEVFPPGLIDAMAWGFRELLTRLAYDPSTWTRLGPDLLPPDQRTRRSAVNATTADVVAGRLQDAVRVHARMAPDRSAVVDAAGVLSYAELRGRGNDLAGRLRAVGVRAGDVVAVTLPRSAGQVVAVCGILTAGAAYVPIDPDWPAPRIRHLLEQTSASAVVTRRDLRDTLADLTRAPLLAMDGVDVRSGTAVDYEPGDGTHLAYVIFTSGSTGSPKGAMLDHRGPLNTVLDINRRFGVGRDDVILGLSSLCFDLSVYDIFGAMAAGATLILPPADANPASWVSLARRHAVTVWNSVPALLELFVEAAVTAGATFPALRLVLLSGDWIPVTLPQRLRELAPQARVVSLGGATEASIWSITHPVDAPDPDWTSIPYGRPLTNQTWHILDVCGRDTPVWTVGELYIGGAGLALGYLGDPRRTAASFVPHPRTGERLYRTGDLGRYLPDGDIELLGRADDQVKIQGFRVEPGEVEHTLSQLPGVRQAAVVARGPMSNRQLAGFVVADGSDPATLLSALRARLPAHLVPSTIETLDALPLTGNGKVDRRALSTVVPRTGPRKGAGVAPRTSLEIEVARIWQDVLGCGPVGRHDDFFALGGQSFAALRVVGQIERQLGLRVSPAVLLRQPTVAGVAAAVASDWTDIDHPLVRLSAGDGREPWFVVHPGGGDVFCYRDLATSLHRPLFAFQAPRRTPTEEPPEVRDYSTPYLRALLDAQPRGPYHLAGWSSGAVIALDLAARLESDGRDVARLVVIDAPAPIAPGPVSDTDLREWFGSDLRSGLPRVDGGDAVALADTFSRYAAVVRACCGYQAPAIAADVTVLRARTGHVAEFTGHPGEAVPDWGWSAVTSGDVTTAVLDGTHHSLLRQPQVASVAAAMNEVHVARHHS